MAGRWGTKSVEQSIADTDEPDTRLPRPDVVDLTVLICFTKDACVSRQPTKGAL